MLSSYNPGTHRRKRFAIWRRHRAPFRSGEQRVFSKTDKLSALTQPASEGLKEFLQQLSAMKVHRSAKDGEARKKPLLLLLLVSRIGDGRLSLNRVGFVDVEKELGSLIMRFGGRSTESGPKPEQPFYHLSSSPFWKVQLADQVDIDLRRTPPLRIIRDPKSFATLAPAVFKLLQESHEARAAVVSELLNRWFPADIRTQLHQALFH